MRIQNNMMAINTHRQLAINQSNQAKSTEKLSSGFRINRAADDAAGLTISEKMRSQVRGLQRASANAQDGISMIQAAEGALQESNGILQRMRELAVQGANGVPGPEDRDAMLSELEQLAEELERIAGTTNFNGKYILSGLYGGMDFEPTVVNPPTVTEDLDPASINLQVGANANLSDVITVNIMGVSRLDLLGEDWGAINSFKDNTEGTYSEDLRVDNATGNVNSELAPPEGDINWQALMNVISGNIYPDGTPIEQALEYTGIARVSELRATLGAVQNRLEHTVANVDTVAENMQSAESRIRDVDMAKEMMHFTKNNILNQAATAMLAQANQAPQTVLQLLQ
ncbi:MAG: flagellin [Oscillospiraceae bacterium]|jgi:flagellin|nr:flagellin [Oscillospiraceae bacterium]